MMTRPQITRMHKQYLLLTALALILSGCQSGLSYRAVDLPAEFAARPNFNGQQFDLSLLGNSGAGSDLINTRDTLNVTVSSGNDEDPPLASELIVAENGTIDVPYLGAVHVTGMTESQATDAVRNASIQRRVFVRPSVSVMFSKKHMHKVTVAGAVTKPGQYEIRASASTLATAVLAAGGLKKTASSRITIHSPGGNTASGPAVDAGTDSILRTGHESESAASAQSGNRAGPQVIQVSLLAAETAQIASQNNLPDGTVITVQEQPARYVTVMGLTGNRNIEMPYDREYRLLDALAQAGGPRFSPWIANKLKVLRPHPQTGETIAIRVNLGEAKRNRDANIPLGPGDVVSVEETPLTFTVSTVSQLLGVGRSAVTATAIP
jgi:polysaccharide biosynthesis/export protein